MLQTYNIVVNMKYTGYDLSILTVSAGSVEIWDSVFFKINLWAQIMMFFQRIEDR